MRAGAPFEAVAVPAESGKRWDLQHLLIVGTNKVIRKLEANIEIDHPMRSVLKEIRNFDRTRIQTVEECSLKTSVVRNYGQTQRRYFWRDGNITHS
jgi:hypothetical protein